MKHIKLLLFLCGIIFLLASNCIKNNEPMNIKIDKIKRSDTTRVTNNSDIIGNWINTSNSHDTLRIFDTDISRWNEEGSCYCHSYKYSIIPDSIILTYDGADKVSIDPYHKMIYLNNNRDTLTIQNLHLVHPGYQGDAFKKF